MCGAFLPDDMDDLSSVMCKRVRAMGYSGIFTRFKKNDPSSAQRSKAERVRSLLADENLRLFQVTGYSQNLVSPDQAVRRDSVRTLQAALKLAGWLGARGIDTGPGSMSSHGPWFPDKENWTTRSQQNLVRSLRECAAAAEENGVYLSMEGHQLVTLESAEVTACILDEVNSPWVTSDYDSANWITRETVYDTGAAVKHHFKVLRKHIISCHAKDIWIENRHALHLQDGCPGKGVMDFATLFREIEKLSPDYPVIVEGAASEEMPLVSDLFHRIARECNIRVLDAHEHSNHCG